MAIVSLLKNVFGTRNERVLKQFSKVVTKINSLEPAMSQLTDTELGAKTAEFRQRLADGTALNSLLPEAFATVREASKRVLKMRHFDVQLIGGMVLHEGNIAEMRTGEGKTLVATLPTYLNALTDKGVHIITVNDYLAKRDAEWMAPVYQFLGMSVGVILSNMPHDAKKAAYAADITYGTNNEFGFDYLRDNMAFNINDKVQRPLNYAIVDEVDSILIDEARTPLIISGPSDESSELYVKINQLIPKLRKREKEEDEGDFYLEEKNKQVYLTESGHLHVEDLMVETGLLQEGESLYDASHITLMHHLNAALRAHHLFHRDVDYIVRNGEIIIVDEHTGRTMIGRRWSDGLHQAVEAKEKVQVQNENQTLASITFQNYFRLYNKLSGMTGTADTEAYEFQQIYGLEVVVIPTNKPMQRKDLTDQIYLSSEEKYIAIIKDIKSCLERQQPVLVGTVSIEASEYLSKLLDKEKIKHQVLNAKFHEAEAKIVAHAGKPGAVTIATNMAGRGTDIVLGGNLNAEIAELENPTPEQIEQLTQDWQVRHDAVIKAGGLHIIGSERHESRRIDNQLRGRSGRQGDPGSTRFYLSLQDNLMRIFASDRVAGIMKRLGMKPGEAIEHPWVNKAIENAQRKVESFNFDIRKQLLEYDDVANEQRKVIYQQRDALMSTTDISESIKNMRTEVLNNLIDNYLPPDSLEEQWDIPALEKQLDADFMLKLPLSEMLEKDASLDEQALRQLINNELIQAYETKEQQIGNETMRMIEKSIMLQMLDTHWKEHLAAMDHLRQGIHLRGYAQKNPKQEYKREAFNLFSLMLDSIKFKVISQLSLLQMPAANTAAPSILPAQPMKQAVHYQHAEVSAFAGQELEEDDVTVIPETTPFKRETPKVGRNDPCHCGSGKKFKFCHGALN